MQLGAGLSYSFKYRNTSGACILFFARDSKGGAYMIDNWNRTFALTPSLEGISVSSSGNNVTIQNGTAAAISVIAICGETKLITS